MWENGFWVWWGFGVEKTVVLVFLGKVTEF